MNRGLTTEDTEEHRGLPITEALSTALLDPTFSSVALCVLCGPDPT
jgi:hypothetical protein